MLSAFVASFAVLVGIYLWFRVHRAEAAAGVILCGAAMWGVSVYTLGHARPILHDMLAPDKMKLLAHHFDEPRHIYIWVYGENGPMSYRMPWNDRKARELHELASRGRGAQIIAKRLPGFMNYGKWTFHPAATQEYPPKTGGTP